MWKVICKKNFLISSQYWLLGAKPNNHKTQQHTHKRQASSEFLVETSLYAGLSLAQDIVTLLLRILRDKTTKDRMDDKITKNNKSKHES